MATPTGGWAGVDDAAIESFARQGFLVVADAFAHGEVDDAVAAIDALLRGADPSYRPARWGRKHGVLLRPGEDLSNLDGDEPLSALVLARGLVEHERRLQNMAEHPRLAAFLQRVMGDTPALIHDMVRAKPPSQGDKPWHQDLTHFNVDHSSTVVTVWIALDDAPLEAGCLHFAPGSHRDGPARHVFGRDYQIPDADVRRVGQVATPVRRGSCVLLNGLVQHGSPPNRSSARRLALQLTFKPGSATMITDDERILAFSGSRSG